MHLSDSALPIGTFAHSFGLETSIKDGRVWDKKSLEDYLEAELKLRIATCELPLMRKVHEAAIKKDFSKIKELDNQIEALKHASENRQASLQMGRSLLNLSVATKGSPLLNKLKTFFAHGGGNYLTILPCVMASRGLSADQAAMSYLYGYLTSRISVAVRLIPMGQTEGQYLLVSMFPLLNVLLETSKTQEEISDFSGIFDIQMMRHETLESRTFKS